MWLSFIPTWHITPTPFSYQYRKWKTKEYVGVPYLFWDSNRPNHNFMLSCFLLEVHLPMAWRQIKTMSSCKSLLNKDINIYPLFGAQVSEELISNNHGHVNNIVVPTNNDNIIPPRPTNLPVISLKGIPRTDDSRYESIHLSMYHEHERRAVARTSICQTRTWWVRINHVSFGFLEFDLSNQS